MAAWGLPENQRWKNNMMTFRQDKDEKSSYEKMVWGKKFIFKSSMSIQKEIGNKCRKLLQKKGPYRR